MKCSNLSVIKISPVLGRSCQNWMIYCQDCMYWHFSNLSKWILQRNIMPFLISSTWACSIPMMTLIIVSLSHMGTLCGIQVCKISIEYLLDIWRNNYSLLDKLFALQLAPGHYYTVLLHDKRIVSRMATPYRSDVPISYLDLKCPKANEIVLAYLRQKMSKAMNTKHSPCSDNTNYELR